MSQSIVKQTKKMTRAHLNKELKRIDKIFHSQQIARLDVARSSAKDRIQKLKSILEWIRENEKSIQLAHYKDFRKPAAEVDLTEIYVVTSEIKHAIRHLKKWMKPGSARRPLAFLTTSSEVRYEPRGNALIIAPWNFPFNLAIGPLVSAIAAGCTAIIKPSEFTPATSRLIKKMLGNLFRENEIAVIEGAVEISTALLKKPFHHIFFTGSPQVGKIVMKAASEYLASVTLELGGKSPVIIDETANLVDAAQKIAWGKCVNNGQICIAPDYAYVHKDSADEFLQNLKFYIKKFYGDSATDRLKSTDYARIISDRHFTRLKKMVDQSVKMGAKIYFGGDSKAKERYISPTVLTDVPRDAPVMTEEIFGPVLPVITYENLQDVIDVINGREKPLALYMFSGKKKNYEQVISSTSAGGTCINEVLLQFLQNELPFGGINNSGIGNSHGIYGFKAFSHERSVLKHHSFAPLKLMMPPYTKNVRRMIDALKRFL